MKITPIKLGIVFGAVSLLFIWLIMFAYQSIHGGCGYYPTIYSFILPPILFIVFGFLLYLNKKDKIIRSRADLVKYSVAVIVTTVILMYIIIFIVLVSNLVPFTTCGLGP